MSSESFEIRKSHCEKLFEVIFMSHILDLCKKASKKVHGLARVTPGIDISKRRIIIEQFSKSQFSYCPLVWMCHIRANHSKINRLHERCQRIIYSDKTSSFEALLPKDCSVSIQKRNHQLLANEM